MTHSAAGADSSKLRPATSGFVLAAGITVLFNTALSCAKDAYDPLKAFLQSLAGHDWTAQGLINLGLFVGLGWIFMSTRVAQRLQPNRLITGLIAASAIAGIGLASWFAFFSR